MFAMRQYLANVLDWVALHSCGRPLLLVVTSVSGLKVMYVWVHMQSMYAESRSCIPDFMV